MRIIINLPTAIKPLAEWQDIGYFKIIANSPSLI